MTEESVAMSRRGFLQTTAGGGAIAGAAGTAAAQEGNESGSGGGGQTVNKTVAVGPGGELVFDPETVTVTPGSTVTWNWDSDTHNIVVENQPEGANWEGTEGPPSKVYDTGHTYEHTFETLGTYDYFCQPHRGVGMVGTVEVVESIETPEPTGPAIPDTAKMLGIATTIGMLSTLGLAYVFLKYGGGGPGVE